MLSVSPVKPVLMGGLDLKPGERCMEPAEHIYGTGVFSNCGGASPRSSGVRGQTPYRRLPRVLHRFRKVLVMNKRKHSVMKKGGVPSSIATVIALNVFMSIVSR